MYCTIIYPLRDHFGLSNADYIVLETISHLSHNIKLDFWCVASARQLSEYTTYSHSTVSRSIQNLESKGLLEKRKMSPSDTAIRPTDLWNNIIADAALMEKMKTSYVSHLTNETVMRQAVSQNDSTTVKMNEGLSQNETRLSQNETRLSQNDSQYIYNTNNNTNTYTYDVARASDGLKKIDSLSLMKTLVSTDTLTRKEKNEDVQRILPTPLLPGGEELAVDENPYGFTVPVKKPELHPFLVVLIEIAREDGCEIRWHSLQDQLREAIATWGESVIEKEFRGYSSFIKTLTNKNIRWDSFKKNRLDPLPTLQKIAEVREARQQGKATTSQKPMPAFDVDAWQYHNSMKSGETPINQETLQKLSDKLTRYGDGAMKDKVIEFIRSATESSASL